ncbi:MAG TPA: DUF4129 domain-containing protein [Vicinamibacteria bacterium]|nr:DUF4129 domain-containing protein [Vicinamibacteria bacterium]
MSRSISDWKLGGSPEVRRPLDFVLLLCGLLAFDAATGAPQEEIGGSGYENRDGGTVENKVAEILSRPEFERLRDEPKPDRPLRERGWLARFIDWLEAWLSRENRSTSPAFALPGFEFLIYAAAALGVGLVLAMMVKAIASGSRSGKIEPSRPSPSSGVRSFVAPGEIAPEEYWRRAIAHGERGRYREAIREILFGAMSSIERRGLIRFRKGLTNRDYRLAVRGTSRESFALIATAFEIVAFGRREPTLESYRACCQEFEKSFRAEETG